MYVSAIIVAGGGGTRFGGPVRKQFLELGGKPVIERTIERFQRCGVINEVILVLPAEDMEQARGHYRSFDKIARIAAGGRTRQESVYNGLLAANPAADVVMAHDAVRPFVSAAVIERAAACAFESGACAAGVPVKDTIKICDENAVVTATPARGALWAAQTPQAFRREVLLNAFRQAEKTGSVYPDDAALAESAGARVRMIMGGYDNIKITTPEDMYLAEIILKRGAIR